MPNIIFKQHQKAAGKRTATGHQESWIESLFLILLSAVILLLLSFGSFA